MLAFSSLILPDYKIIIVVYKTKSQAFSQAPESSVSAPSYWLMPYSVCTTHVSTLCSYRFVAFFAYITEPLFISGVFRWEKDTNSLFDFFITANIANHKHLLLLCHLYFSCFLISPFCAIFLFLCYHINKSRFCALPCTCRLFFLFPFYTLSNLHLFFFCTIR